MNYHMALKPIAIFAAGLCLLTLPGCSDDRNERAEVANEPATQAEALRGDEEVLLAFDSGTVPLGTETESAAVNIVADDNGGGALDILFTPDIGQAAVRLHPPEPWDWSDRKDFNIAIDAENTGTESVHLFLSLRDSDGNRASRSITIAPGESNTYFAVLDGLAVELETGLRENPPPWETSEEMFIYGWRRKGLDLGSVAEIVLYVSGTIAPKRVLIDNIRLRNNPGYDLSYLEGFVDEFGQNATVDYPIKINSVEELKLAADDELAALSASAPLPDRSRFGGWKDGPRLEATGYFRTEKVDGKWWMVDPEGYLFFSNGLANVRMANLTTFTGIDFSDPAVRHVDPSEVTPEDSIGMIQVSDEARQTRYVASPLRRNMFNWLPEYDDDLANHYSFRRSTHSGPMNGGETFSFYRANLERRYGETGPDSFVRKWEDVTLSRMLDWGFTSMGNWVDPAFYPNERVPYFANGWIIGNFKTLNSVLDVWAPMPDAFDPEFVRRAEITISVIADEINASPWCVGVFVDNEKSWGRPEGTVPERYSLILDALSRDAGESPAKAAFTRHLQTTYNDVETVNARWNTRLASWEALASGVEFEEYSPGLVEDLSTMLQMLSEEYFRVVRESLAKYLPNHLYMGVRMAGWGMPDETVKAAVKYSDVLSFNIYEEGLLPEEWAFLEEIDLPSIIGEWHVGATSDTGLLHPGIIYASDQADRAEMYRDYMDSVLANDSMVGAHWFQYVDSPITGRAHDGENYNVGFVSVTDIPYPEMIQAAREFNRTLYSRRYGEAH